MKKQPAKSSIPQAIRMAITRAERELQENGRLPRLIVQHNPFSDQSKITPYVDCEDGVQICVWSIK
jgi:hypothetical protein